MSDRVLSFQLGKRRARRVQALNEFGAVAASVAFGDLAGDADRGATQLTLQSKAFVPGQ